MGKMVFSDSYISVKEAQEKLIEEFGDEDMVPTNKRSCIDNALVKCKFYSFGDFCERGTWKEWKVNGITTFTCSRCGYPSEERTRYCPNCGAEMSQEVR